MNETFLTICCCSWGDTMWRALWPNTDLLYVGNKCVSFESPLPVHWTEWVQIGRWSSRSGFSESINHKCGGSNKIFSPDWLSRSHLLCNIPDIKMPLNQWRTGGGWCERAQCRRRRVSHERRRHLGELHKKMHTSTRRNTITTNHAWRKKTQERARRAGGRRTAPANNYSEDNIDMHSENIITVNLSFINNYRTIHGILWQK